jgi:hypothetical protein
LGLGGAWSVDLAVLQLRDTGGRDELDDLQFGGLGTEMIEQTDTASEQHWYEVDLDLVEQPGLS